MAPEIGLGRYGKEIDIYALGILLYEMLTGHVPFEGESSQEIIMKHLTTQPNLSSVPVPYRAVIARAMAKDPTDRYRSVDEMSRAIAPFRGGTDASASAGLGTPPPLPNGGGASRAIHGVHDWARGHPEEPIAAAFRNRAHRFRHWWRAQTSFGRVVMIIAGLVLFPVNAAWLFPTLFGGLHHLYRILFGLVLFQPNTRRSTSVADEWG